GRERRRDEPYVRHASRGCAARAGRRALLGHGSSLAVGAEACAARASRAGRAVRALLRDLLSALARVPRCRARRARERDIGAARVPASRGGKTCLSVRKPVRGLPCVPSASRRSRRQSNRKSTRLNSSHVKISYAAFCLKKKTTSAFM